MSRMELDALRKLVSASGAGLEAKSGASLDKPALDAVGPSRCELEELVQKLSPMERPDSELDVSKAKSAEHFADRMNAAVPKVDKAPPTE